MLQIPPSIYRKRMNRKPRPVPPMPVNVTVLAVRLISPELLDFEFSSPVTTNGNDAPEIVVFNTNIGDASPVGSEQQNETTVRFGFEPGVGIDVGDEWSISAVPACLDLNGGVMSVPQSGSIDE